MSSRKTYLKDLELVADDLEITGDFVQVDGEEFYRISNYDRMPPFFMNLVSADDHWMFIASNGALTAGRKNPDFALFPYYTDDKITDSPELSGGKSIFRVIRNGHEHIWEPFSERYKRVYATRNNLYKNKSGDRLIFEEINIDLQLNYTYQWGFAGDYGFCRKGQLVNIGDTPVKISALDGIRNILPHGISSEIQNQKSTLADAYKRAELQSNGLAIISLSSMIVDRAEPSEALRATTVWSVGVPVNHYLLSSDQLKLFRTGVDLNTEHEHRAGKCAYFIQFNLELQPNTNHRWSIIADVGKSVSDVLKLQSEIADSKNIKDALDDRINDNTDRIQKLVRIADGHQKSADKLACGRHFSNVLYNIMRGGIFEDQYEIGMRDFVNFIKKHNRSVYSEYRDYLYSLPAIINYFDFVESVDEINDINLTRLVHEYLPLSFGRRHGDPSRPWNTFNIRHGSASETIKYFEGNWRDLFQNWEALLYSFPGFTSSVISKFLNASTIDGYNPYRITRNGIDWEVIEPHDPWSYIGYWGDHQIIYLQKLLELQEKHFPGSLSRMMGKEMFAYANVPYRIRSFNDIRDNPKDTIDFDLDLDKKIKTREAEIGSDARLISHESGDILYVTFIEKILVSLLTKLYNFIPGAGIWMNTQRPEWNDANNALVGNGVSMVTLYHIRRMITFFMGLENSEQNWQVSAPLKELFDSISQVFNEKKSNIIKGIDDSARLGICVQLGLAGEVYRTKVYGHKNFNRKDISSAELTKFLNDTLVIIDKTIEENKGADGLYHSYNIIEFRHDALLVKELYPMLEGQVAVLSSGFLDPSRTLELLDKLKKSDMYREDQYSYMLYPERELKGFMDKNTIPVDGNGDKELLERIYDIQGQQIIERDHHGGFHFDPEIQNSRYLDEAIQNLNGEVKSLTKEDRDQLQKFYEAVFDHRSFTGRSGTFFAYEGIGSIYWHMVSKLLLEVQETIHRVKDLEHTDLLGRLKDHYYEIRAGIGMNKSPELYGAFPTDAYSHTPKTSGARQPGLTGQVKEDIINRWAELGVKIKDGCISFDTRMLNPEEFFKEDSQDSGTSRDELYFTYCQVDVVFRRADSENIIIEFTNGENKAIEGLMLAAQESREIFNRTGSVKKLIVDLKV